MSIRVLILGLLTIMCCSTRHDTQPDDDNAGKQKKGGKESILYGKEIRHEFSSPVAKDTFKLFVTGQSINDGQVKFQIVSKDSVLILSDTFPTTAFLDNALKDNATNQEKEEHIKNRIGKFFNQDNFHQPAIDSKDTFDEDYSNRDIWDDIISDQTAIGFYYLIGEEDGRHIAYSKSLRKVLLYYSCC
jgi:hypothetical protein